MKRGFGFVCFSLKKNILPFLFVSFTVFLVLFSKSNLQATKSGLLLWANSVVPALLPFFIATELLSHTNVVATIGKWLNHYMRPFFRVPGIGAYAFIMGIISGYPIGAKIVTKFRQDGLCTKAEAERLLAFTNNSGPLFIIGTVGITLFGNTQIGILLFLTHFLSCILVGFLFRFWKYHDNEKVHPTMSSTTNFSVTFSNLGEVLADSILNAIHTIFVIGGFVVLFSVILSILKECQFFHLLNKICSPFCNLFGISEHFITPIASGILELTNGLRLVCEISAKAISTNIIICSFLLGFGGFSVLLQVLSITSKSDISIKAYFLGKLLQGIFSAILTAILIHIFPIFNFDITPIVSLNVETVTKSSSFYSFAIFTLMISFLYFLFQKKRSKRMS